MPKAGPAWHHPGGAHVPLRSLLHEGPPRGILSIGNLKDGTGAGVKQGGSHDLKIGYWGLADEGCQRSFSALLGGDSSSGFTTQG